MPLSIRNPRAETLAREVARVTGANVTDAIITALEEKLARIDRFPRMEAEYEAIMEISRRSAALPTLDDRPEAEIPGYNDEAS